MSSGPRSSMLLRCLLTTLFLALWGGLAANGAAWKTECPWIPAGPLLLGAGKACPLPIDDAVAARTGDWAPWTHRPFCVVPVSEVEKKVKYCVFTSTVFNGNKGISVITTPEAAASIVDVIRFADPRWYRHEHFNGSRYDGAGQPPYEVVALPGKGKSLVAKRPIFRGEVIMLDSAAILASVDFAQSVSPLQGGELVKRAFDQLPDQMRVMSLARSKGGRLLEDIMRTNSFGVKFKGNKVRHMGLFPDVARINHACDPNAFARFSPDSLTMEVVAWKDITAGAEIEISYAPKGLTSDLREQFNKAREFKCQCSLCSAPPDQIRESDERRRRISSIRTQLTRVDELTYIKMVDLSEELLDLVYTEKLEMDLGEYYELFSKLYYHFDDIEAAKEYAEAGVKYFRKLQAPDEEFERRFEVYMRQLDKRAAEVL